MSRPMYQLRIINRRVVFLIYLLEGSLQGDQELHENPKPPMKNESHSSLTQSTVFTSLGNSTVQDRGISLYNQERGKIQKSKM